MKLRLLRQLSIEQRSRLPSFRSWSLTPPMSDKFLWIIGLGRSLTCVHGDDKWSLATGIPYAGNVAKIQAPSTRYLLRVVMTSVTMVPKSPHSHSACEAREEDCPVASPSYGGRVFEPSVPDNNCEGVNVPSTFTGTNLHVCQACPPLL